MVPWSRRRSPEVLLMLALDAVPLLAVFIMYTAKKLDVILSLGPGILLATCGGRYPGTSVASLTSRRVTARPQNGCSVTLAADCFIEQ